MTNTAPTVGSDPGTGVTVITLPPGSDLLVGGTGSQPSPAIQLRNTDGSLLSHDVYSNSLLVGSISGNQLKTSLNYESTRADLL